MALLVATHEYEDSGLRQLTSPPHDAEGLAAVLADPRIAGFEVTALIDEPQYRIGQAIGEFYQGRRRDDLVLLYFSGHGLKDDTGKLYLATTNTAGDNLLFTAVSAEQVDQAMDACVSRQKVLVLDCCYGGAFPAARLTKGDTAVHALERFNGRGRTVLTASDATQYSFEGDQAHGEAVQSVFTRYLVSGLRDGSTDLDGDGDITLDELYSYVHDRVVEVMPQQRPKGAHDHRPQRQLAAAGLPGERDQESYRDRPPRGPGRPRAPLSGWQRDRPWPGRRGDPPSRERRQQDRVHGRREPPGSGAAAEDGQ